MGCRKLQITDFFHRTDIRTSLTHYNLSANKAEKTYRRFFRSLSLQGEDLIAETNHATSKTYLALQDGNKNIVGYIDSSDGTSVADYEYSPFGKLIVKSGTMADEFAFKFSSYYTDNETDIVYYGYRYYDANMGRWLNRDPIEEDGGANVYGFVGNDGINKWDRFGLKWNDPERKGGPRAEICRDSTKDKWTDLAKKLKLGRSYSEILKWLKLPDGSDITPGDVGDKFKFSVPNTLHITYGNMSTSSTTGIRPWKGWKKFDVLFKDAMTQVQDYYKKEGYNVSNHVEGTGSTGNSVSSIQGWLGDADIAMWAHAGHGKIGHYKKKPGAGMLVIGESLYGAQGLKPSLHHKLSEIILFSCYGAYNYKNNWFSMIASGGQLRAYDKPVNMERVWWTLPKHIKP